MLKGLHTLICEVTDMDRAVAFYGELLGLDIPFSSPHWTSVSLGSARLGLHPPMGQSTANGGGWIVGVEVEDIAALRKLLNDNGHQTGDYHDTPAGVVMDFADPDGNRLQAMQIGVKAASVLGQ